MSARAAILATTRSRRLARLGQRYGMRLGASRFVAGETLHECIAVLRELDRRGIAGYAIVLGESVTDRAAVAGTVDAYRDAVGRLGALGLGVTMSIKLTHVGLLIGEDVALASAQSILGAAAEAGVFVRLDMEGSRHVDAALRIYRRLRADGLSNTGVALQAYLYRSERDLRDLLGLGLNVRLVKGAYLEAPSVAFPRKADVDRNYLRLIDIALGGAEFTAVATHDERAIDAAVARQPGARRELQLLYGVRPQLQRRLVAAGHRVRVCVPYGTDWFVYFGRRLAERPANLAFVARSLVAR